MTTAQPVSHDKTIRLLYPDHVSGGLSTYFLGAKLLAAILPENPNQPLVKVDIAATDGKEPIVTDGIAEKPVVLDGIRKAQAAIDLHSPTRIITIGGNCITSLAPFDYLHRLYPDAGILWIDAHPDVSVPENGYPNAHAMVLAALLGRGEPSLIKEMRSPAFAPDDLLYVGLQALHDYQQRFLDDAGVDYEVQTEAFVSKERLAAFLKAHEQVLVHLDIDVLDPRFFHSTYFANPELTGDGSGGGRMTLEELSTLLNFIAASSDIVGMTIAEYLPFEAERLQRIFCDLKLFTRTADPFYNPANIAHLEKVVDDIRHGRNVSQHSLLKED